MMRSRIAIAAAAAVTFSVLFAAPAVTNAMPLTPVGSQAVTTAAKQVNGIEQVARRYYKKKRYYGRRYGRYNRAWRHRYARCWNCGYRRHYRYGSPFVLSFGFPYPHFGYYPRYYGYYYPRYYGRYYGSSVWYGGKRR